MNQRTLLLNELRGETIGIITTQSSNEETFQNQVLRPILKLQNDLFLAVFENYIHKNKKDFHTLGDWTLYLRGIPNLQSKLFKS